MKPGARYVAEGLPARALAAAALLLALALMGGMLLVVALGTLHGLWPRDLEEFVLKDGRLLLGERWGEDEDPQNPGSKRLRLKVGNRDLTGQDFRYVSLAQVTSIRKPPEAVALEREEYGNFYGFLESLQLAGQALPVSAPHFPQILQQELKKARKLAKERNKLLAQASTGTLSQAAQREVATLQEQLDSCQVLLRTVEGHSKEIPCSGVVHVGWPNRLGLGGKLREFARRGVEFLTAEPRESNTEGGIFPALFGTAFLVMLMTLFVVPLGVLTAIYLREYARDNTFTRGVRMAVNTLAGVPSIVFGTFGLAFFVYQVGGTLDKLFFSESLPTPTLGTGGVLWASLTMALLTVPVVVVATEEGLAAAPREVREGARALGATRWETLRRVILPYAKPGILTGVILAVARAAGEVAPLMLTGVVKLAPTLPVDTHPPFVHLERKFMHLGFHIYDVGFQSPNVEAARPMIFATTLVLLLLVLLLNWVALLWRTRARKALAGGVL
jgi:phosphate transport system permease protein